MDSEKLREEFLKFFEKNGHKIVPSSSLVPSDPSVLLTTAGMQQFKPYYLGEKSPFGLNVATSQKCFRTSDIEEVGNSRHLTFFEMLGNFSFGGYFKKEAISYAFEFITKVMGLPISYVTVFKGSDVVPEDKESRAIWNSLGVKDVRGQGMEDVFWGPTGGSGPCGPTTEIYCKNAAGEDIEIWNIVFNEFIFPGSREELLSGKSGKTLQRVEMPGVDTGMGLERMAMVCQKKESVYETHLFQPIIEEISKVSGKPYSSNLVSFRIIADHVKASVFLISDGVLPSNTESGYILRRLLRRAIRHGKLLNSPKDFLIPLAKKVAEIYHSAYPELTNKSDDILTVIHNEAENFIKTLEKGLREFEKIKPKEDALGIIEGGLNGDELFNLYSTYGFPIELSLEEIEKIYKNHGQELPKDIKETFIRLFYESLKKHQEISRAGAEKKFGGVGKEANEESAKLHTATHLLHQSLKKVLGDHVKQMGSDITSQRLRFDFSHHQKVTPEEIKKVEEIINQKIIENLTVKKEEMSLEMALKSGAMAFFKEKYPPKVSVYSMGNPSDPSGKFFSKEICAGPHADRTGKLGHFKIIKEESAGAGIRRIRAVLELK